MPWLWREDNHPRFTGNAADMMEMLSKWYERDHEENASLEYWPYIYAAIEAIHDMAMQRLGEKKKEELDNLIYGDLQEKELTAEDYFNTLDFLAENLDWRVWQGWQTHVRRRACGNR